jgi:hypothetical protein
MTSTVSRSAWLRLYKNLFAEAKKFNTYNYREYAKRRIRDYFRENINERDSSKLRSLYEYGSGELKSLKRQTTLVRLYEAPKLIIENLALGERVSKELGEIKPNTDGKFGEN